LVGRSARIRRSFDTFPNGHGWFSAEVGEIYTVTGSSREVKVNEAKDKASDLGSKAKAREFVERAEGGE
jgi:hypothetical protein